MKVFVSYSRYNLDIVTQLTADLRDVGVNIWYDQKLSGGQKWWDQILAGLRDCDIFIFALSPQSLESEACKSELGYVAQLNKFILPVQVSDGVNLNFLPPPLNEFQVTDYRKGDKQQSFAVLRAINTAPPPPPLPEKLPEPPPVPISYLNTLKQQIDSNEPLTYKSQLWLVAELEEELKKDPSARDLLLRLKARDETLAKIATKIDSALENHAHNVPAQTRRTNRPPETVFVPPVAGKSEGKDAPPLAEARVCPQCSSRVEAGKNVCAACGSQISPTGLGVSRHMENSEIRQYRCDASKLPNMIVNIKAWLDSQGFDSQKLNTENQSLLIQIKKRGSWREYVGMDTTLNVLFQYSNEILTVEIGAGKWADKAAAGAVGFFFLAPLAITAGIGMWDQMKMPDKIFDYIATRLDYRT